jgi:hypothetical protein
MKVISGFLLLTISCSGISQTSAQSSSSAATEKELVGMAQELYDAIAVGNKAPWGKYVADDVIYTDENWQILTKKICWTG